jgi:2,4-dihydroxy-1,4-benzoxazin-3-one-glucoside dioxygenase
MASTRTASSGYDRLSELKAFDGTKAGVKGLVDAGVTAVPRIFHHPAPAAQESPRHPRHNVTGSRVPVIDLAAAKPDLVAQVKAAAETVGFFQVIKHGVPGELLAQMLASVRRFHEEPVGVKAPCYTRDRARPVRYETNFDLFTSPAANWRDTLFMDMKTAEPEDVPPACRGTLPEYTAKVKQLVATLLGLLSEAIGLERAYLEKNEAGDGLAVTGHYYPPCPEPWLTLGTTKHSDTSFLTVLLQDNVGRLQVLLDDGSWVDVPPVPGALVVNIGDLLQLVSNDRFKSVEHRVLALDPARESRLPASSGLTTGAIGYTARSLIRPMRSICYTGALQYWNSLATTRTRDSTADLRWIISDSDRLRHKIVLQ